MDNVKQHTNKVPWLEPYQYKRGDSGNPHGRPQGKSITAELNKIIARPGKAQELAQALVDMATDKHNRAQLPAISITLDRTDGKVPDVKLIKGMIVSITGDDMAKLSQQILDAEKLLLDGDDDANEETQV